LLSRLEWAGFGLRQDQARKQRRVAGLRRRACGLTGVAEQGIDQIKTLGLSGGQRGKCEHAGAC